MPPLTNGKHEIVAQALAAGKGDVDACIEAGYSENTALKGSRRIVHRPDIQARAAELLKQRADATLVDVTKMHRRYSEMFEADIGDIMATADCRCTEELRPKCPKCCGSGLMAAGYKPVHMWPKVWRQMLAGLDVKELMGLSEGGDIQKIGELVKIKFAAMKDIGELLGRLRPVNAFVQPKEEQASREPVQIQIVHVGGELGVTVPRAALKATPDAIEVELVGP